MLPLLWYFILSILKWASQEQFILNKPCVICGVRKAQSFKETFIQTKRNCKQNLKFDTRCIHYTFLPSRRGAPLENTISTMPFINLFDVCQFNCFITGSADVGKSCKCSFSKCHKSRKNTTIMQRKLCNFHLIETSKCVCKSLFQMLPTTQKCRNATTK